MREKKGGGEQLALFLSSVVLGMEPRVFRC